MVHLVRFQIVNGVSFACYQGNVCICEKQMDWENFSFSLDTKAWKKYWQFYTLIYFNDLL